MNDVWFYDLKKVLRIFKQLFPNIHTFQSIKGTPCGDFIITTSSGTYLIDHFNFDIYCEDSEGEWIIIKCSKE